MYALDDVFLHFPDGDEGDPGSESGGGEPAPAASAGAAVAAPADPAPPAEGAAPTTAPPVDVADILNSPDAQPILEERFNEWLNAAAQQQEQQGQADPFADVLDAFEVMGIPPQRFQEYMQSQMAPVNEVRQQFETQQALQGIDKTLGELAVAHPEMYGEQAGELGDPNRYATLSLAGAFMQAAKQERRELSHEQALQQASGWLVERDKKVAAAAVERNQKELEALSGAPTSPSGNGAVTSDATGPARSEQDAVKAWMERNNIPR